MYWCIIIIRINYYKIDYGREKNSRTVGARINMMLQHQLQERTIIYGASMLYADIFLSST